eukprot:TRINITY_DN7660_c0_g1_i1.p1 TRINITY_DN7660_c0_g1~~TRINITY_DN7660_c0_g1_i1.p1  ORF type:complete len:868 (+),score=91.28 TRINITY_DN7660_c0_g1_i1:55-2658(+)
MDLVSPWDIFNLSTAELHRELQVVAERLRLHPEDPAGNLNRHRQLVTQELAEREKTDRILSALQSVSQAIPAQPAVPPAQILPVRRDPDVSDAVIRAATALLRLPAISSATTPPLSLRETHSRTTKRPPKKAPKPPRPCERRPQNLSKPSHGKVVSVVKPAPKPSRRTSQVTVQRRLTVESNETQSGTLAPILPSCASSPTVAPGPYSFAGSSDEAEEDEEDGEGADEPVVFTEQREKLPATPRVEVAPPERHDTLPEPPLFAPASPRITERYEPLMEQLASPHVSPRAPATEPCSPVLLAPQLSTSCLLSARSTPVLLDKTTPTTSVRAPSPRSIGSYSMPTNRVQEKPAHGTGVLQTKPVEQETILRACHPAMLPTSVPEAPRECFDYTRQYPTFCAIFTPVPRTGAPPKPLGEYEILVEQRSLLAEWYAENALDFEGQASEIPNPGDWTIDGSAFYYKAQQSREEVYDLVTTVMNSAFRGVWAETETHMWNLLWTWSKPQFKHKSLLVWQMANHYPNSINLTRKDLLKKHISKYRRLPGKSGATFNISPKTFILPAEYVPFVDEFARDEEAGGRNIWIMKPVGMSRGRGIELVSGISQVTYGSSVVIQRYIEDPFLIDGYKFDLRLYVVVTSFSPLEAFLYKKGFARFASVKFTLDPASLCNRYVHLTNTAVQSDAPCLPSFYRPESGMKWGLQELSHRLDRLGVDWPAVWDRIADVVLKCLCCTEDGIENAPGCFELFGFDVMLDSSLRPWIIEVNASPSMECDTPLDEEVKASLIGDTIRLLDPVPFNRRELLEILERRLAEYSKPASKRTGNKREQLNRDLHSVLGGRVPRAYGEMPHSAQHFVRLAPSPNYTKYSKSKRT